MSENTAPFFLGVNYPWVNYGQDFGRSPWGARGVSTPQTKAIVADDFARIRESGASVVRWFLFCDGRSGIKVANGVPTGPDELLFADVGAALALAQQHHLRLCFSLIDFLWMQNRPDAPNSPLPPNQSILKFAAGREALLETVFIPLFSEFRDHPSLFAWEAVNEPEWAIREFQNDRLAVMHVAEFRPFAAEMAAAAHEFAGSVPVTLGSARLLWMRAWSEIGLDLLQAHYYPRIEKDQKGGLDDQLKKLEPQDQLGAPLWLGELPAQEPASPEYSVEAALDACKAAGLAGAAVWRWRNPEAGGSDAALGAADPAALQAWLSRSTSISV